jgi:hypothetical protein
MLKNWLDKLLGRTPDPDDADEARVEAEVDSDRVDRSAGRVMGVYGDLGPTVPSPESPHDRPPAD